MSSWWVFHFITFKCHTLHISKYSSMFAIFPHHLTLNFVVLLYEKYIFYTQLVVGDSFQFIYKISPFDFSKNSIYIYYIVVIFGVNTSSCYLFSICPQFPLFFDTPFFLTTFFQFISSYSILPTLLAFFYTSLHVVVTFLVTTWILNLSSVS